MADLRLKQAFEALDTDNSGFLDVEELRMGLKDVLGFDAETAEVFLSLDTDGDNQISFEEFQQGVECALAQENAVQAIEMKKTTGDSAWAMMTNLTVG